MIRNKRNHTQKKSNSTKPSSVSRINSVSSSSIASLSISAAPSIKSQPKRTTSVNITSTSTTRINSSTEAPIHTSSRRTISTSSNFAPVTIPSRNVSINTKNKLVRTKKRLMLEVPAPSDVFEVGVNDGVTAFNKSTQFAAFHHPMPDINTTSHPLLAKPTIPHPNQMFAVIDVNGFQHKVTKDDQVMVNHLKDVEIGEQLAFEHVYLLGGRDFTLLGKPYVPSVSVIATVEEHTTLAPVTVWRYKRRTGYRNLNRQRDVVTILRVDDIQLDDPSIIPEIQPLQAIPVVQVKPTPEDAVAEVEQNA